MITKFPAEKLLVSGGHRYLTVDGPMRLTHEAQSHVNTPAGRGEAAKEAGHDD